MKKKYIMTIIVMLIVSTSGCGREIFYRWTGPPQIEYPRRLLSKQIKASVCITSAKEPVYICSSCLLGGDLSVHRKKRIMEGFRKIDINKVMESELLKQKELIGPLILFDNKPAFKLQRGTAEINKTEKLLSPVDYSKYKDKIKTRYILDLNVREWGMMYYTGRPFFILEFSALLYDRKDRAVIWHFQEYSSHRYLKNESILDVNDVKTYRVVEKSLHQCIQKIIKDIVISKKRK